MNEEGVLKDLPVTDPTADVVLKFISTSLTSKPGLVGTSRICEFMIEREGKDTGM